MLTIFKRWLSNCRLHKKVVLIVALTVAIVASASTAALRIVINRYDSLLYSSMAESLSLFVREIEANLQSVSNASSFIISDQSVQGVLEEYITAETQIKKSAAGTNLYALLHTHATLNKYITAISVRMENGEVITAYTNPLTRDEAFYEQVAALARENDGRPVWMRPEGETRGIICTRTIRKIRFLSLQELGVLIVHVDLEKIIRDSQYSADGQKPSIAILAEGKTIYPEDAPDLSNLLPPDTPYTILELEGERQFVVQRPAGSLGWIYVRFSPYNNIFESIMFSQFIFVAAVAVAIGLSILVANLLTQNITRHFDRLGKKMDSFQSGDLQPLDVHYDYSWRQDEMGAIHRHFDQMLRSISELIEDNYVKQLLIKDSRIKTLEQQINPHFLYNTLNSIHWRATAAEQPEISRMVQALGSLLRNTLSEHADAIPLSRELVFVDNYMEIQKMRYEERLEFTTMIDPSLMELPIPKMSIQPLIENAIKYSLEEVTEACSICLRAEKRDGAAVIEVINSGSFIDEDILDKLARGEQTPKGQGIGLSNIDSRVKLLFGREYGLTFHNRDECACVAITLPLPREIAGKEGQDAEAGNSRGRKNNT